MIREATPADIPSLIVIGAMFHSLTVLSELLPYDGESVRQLLTASIANPDCAVFVLEDNGEIAGGICGTVVPLYWNMNVRVGQQLAWFVRPSRRHGLLALGLLDAFERWAFDEKGADATFSGAKNDENGPAMGKMLGRRKYINLESVHIKVRGRG